METKNKKRLSFAVGLVGVTLAFSSLIYNNTKGARAYTKAQGIMNDSNIECCERKQKYESFLDDDRKYGLRILYTIPIALASCVPLSYGINKD